MASIISAGTTSGTALNMTADTSGQLQLATGASATTAVTIDTSQNVGIGTTSPATKLQVTTASGTSSSIRINQTSNGDWQIYNPASSTDLRFYDGTTDRVTFATGGNVGIGTTATSLAKLTVNGNITPSAAPNAFWGLDYAPSSSSGTYITIANNATYSFASGSGATFVYEDSGAVGAVMFMSVYGTTYTVWQSGTGYSNVPTTASKVNFGYSAGAYYLENKTGSSKNLFVSNIRMRTGS